MKDDGEHNTLVVDIVFICYRWGIYSCD
jgi:hypothetical protein